MIGLISAGSAASGCSHRGAREDEGREQMPAKTIEEVLREHTEEWMAVPGVVGTGIGECEGRPCIRVMVVKKTPELLKKIPSRVEGFLVDVQETGMFRPRDPG